MSDLPVFAFCDPEVQAEQVKTYLKAFGAENINEKAQSNAVVENLNEIINHAATLAKLDETETEAVLNSVISLFTLVGRDELLALVEKLCSTLMTKPMFAGKESCIIRALGNLFHAVSYTQNVPEQQQQKTAVREPYVVYCTMLKVAADAGLIRMMITDLDRLKQWFDTWRISIDERRRCLRLLHDALVKSHQVEAPAKVMLELLSSYTTEADAATAKDDARQCIRSAICDPGTFVFDHLLELRPVQSLSNEKIYELLKIFVGDTLKAYLKFYDDNKAFVEKEFNGAEGHAANVHKMRVLTLMDIGETRTNVPLKELSQQLGLSDGEELEEFIIKAIQSKAVKAKIDQMNQQLIIGGVKNRKFAKAQWETLKNKLDTWASSLNQVKRYLDTVTAE